MGKGMKFPGMGGLGNMQGMLQKVQKMQGEMQKMQEELQARTFEATVGGGAVTVVMSGKKELQSIKLAPTAVGPRGCGYAAGFDRGCGERGYASD